MIYSGLSLTKRISETESSCQIQRVIGQQLFGLQYRLVILPNLLTSVKTPSRSMSKFWVYCHAIRHKHIAILHL